MKALIMTGNAFESTVQSFDVGKLFVCVFSGFSIGLASGLLGVGGGEFRIPVLLYLLDLPVLLSITINLLIGLLTVSVSFIMRYWAGPITPNAINIALFMSSGSILGGYIGAHLAGKLNESLLRKFLIVLLIAVGLRMIFDPLVELPPSSVSFPYLMEIAFSMLVGLLIGVVSGLLGVAGGEYRIPVLIYLFGFPVKIAGTVSLLVSIPTILAGFIKHWRIGHLNNYGVAIGLTMGFASVLGSYVGASFVTAASEGLLKMLLGIVLLLATVRMVTKP
ncbi:MAG: sulfite exporter TauE/SafE family protein [Candidatus Brockarchaeota archaeon]|nr:sulfite exporter TauE/SafE family protein [Candidatus Brockarchaeota archaeon]MBO3808211.1 sulfite exporter TauE/SafE family protein [Candidatus Brockarchaeota archaeon]